MNEILLESRSYQGDNFLFYKTQGHLETVASRRFSVEKMKVDTQNFNQEKIHSNSLSQFQLKRTFSRKTMQTSQQQVLITRKKKQIITKGPKFESSNTCLQF